MFWSLVFGHVDKVSSLGFRSVVQIQAQDLDSIWLLHVTAEDVITQYMPEVVHTKRVGIHGCWVLTCCVTTHGPPAHDHPSLRPECDPWSKPVALSHCSTRHSLQLIVRSEKTHWNLLSWTFSACVARYLEIKTYHVDRYKSLRPAGQISLLNICCKTKLRPCKHDQYTQLHALRRFTVSFVCKWFI